MESLEDRRLLAVVAGSVEISNVEVVGSTVQAEVAFELDGGNVAKAQIQVLKDGKEVAASSDSETGVSAAGSYSGHQRSVDISSLVPGDYQVRMKVNQSGGGAQFSGEEEFSYSNEVTITVLPSVTLIAADATYTGSAYAGAVATVLDGATNVSGFGTTTVKYYSDAGATNEISAPTNAGTYYAKAFFVSDGIDHGVTTYLDAESAVESFSITAISLDEFASASTQSTLNIAKDGTVSFAINVSEGIVDGQTVADLFNGATFTLSMKTGDTYETVTITANATVIDGIVYVNLRMNQEFYTFLKQGLDAGETNASKASLETITLSATSNDNNYTLSADVLTRIFQTGKVNFS